MHFVIAFLSMNYKGGLISESFLRWLKSTKKCQTTHLNTIQADSA